MKTTQWIEQEFVKLEATIGVHSDMYDVLDKAKEMEFEQRKKDFVNGYKARAKESNLIFDETSEKYAIYLFNETFKSE
jgi:hypothetical protein